jgi:hypothetical protein
MDQPPPHVGDTFHGVCDGCGFWPVGLTAYGQGVRLSWLCELCAHTPTGALIHGSPDRALLRTICYVGNAVLAARSTSK